MYQRPIIVISRYFAYTPGEEATFELESLKKNDLRSLSIHGIAVVVDDDTVIELSLSKPTRRFSPVNLNIEVEGLGKVEASKDKCLYFIGGASFAREEHQMAVDIDIAIRYEMALHRVVGRLKAILPDEVDKKITSIEVSYMLEATPMGDPAEDKQVAPVPKDIPL